MTEPTDAEIVALADATRTAEGGANGYILPISFARAVLEKWGAQPVPAGYALVPIEPTPEMLSAMWVNKNSSLSEAYNSLSEAYSAMLAASPQPVVVREPLTNEQIKAAAAYHEIPIRHTRTFIIGARFAERHHGIKGGQHGTE